MAREVGPGVGEETVDFLSSLSGEGLRLVQTVAVDDKVDERRAFVVGQLVHCPGTIANMAVTENEKKIVKSHGSFINSNRKASICMSTAHCKKIYLHAGNGCKIIGFGGGPFGYRSLITLTLIHVLRQTRGILDCFLLSGTAKYACNSNENVCFESLFCIYFLSTEIVSNGKIFKKYKL